MLGVREGEEVAEREVEDAARKHLGGEELERDLDRDGGELAVDQLAGVRGRGRRVGLAELREQEELDSIRPPLDGKQVMQFLAVVPGPVVGEALDFLLEARLDEGPIDEADAYARLTVWARERGTEPAGA